MAAKGELETGVRKFCEADQVDPWINVAKRKAFCEETAFAEVESRGRGNAEATRGTLAFDVRKPLIIKNPLLLWTDKLMK